MLRLVPLVAYLALICAVLFWRFGEGPSAEQLAERARLAPCTFSPLLEVTIGQLHLRLPAVEAVSAVSATGQTYEIASNPAPSATNFGFCPNAPSTPFPVASASIAFQAKLELLTGTGLPEIMWGQLLISAYEAPSPGPVQDWARLVPMPDGKGGLITQGESPDGLRIAALCSATDCLITAFDRTLGLRVSLEDVPFGAALSADETLPDALQSAAKRLHAAILTWQVKT
ncbi:MAG: hypothetical protein K9G71_03950 [Rhodobacteraceae bacterium]|nr:hypothetical protein [Paracoccaceae bacterium]MCF8513369.1 hypothetical protein [Paracoccaceae bacterium]MCF8517731.1 hypothetical protein [Paracoccaceae bacterium]